MQVLKLKEQANGHLILFKVPEGEEKEWVRKFKAFSFVEEAALNHIYKMKR